MKRYPFMVVYIAIAHTAAHARIEDATGAVAMATIVDMLERALEVGK